MSLQLYSAALKAEVEQMASEGRTKAPERVIIDYTPASGGFGPRYTLQGSDQKFMRCILIRICPCLIIPLF